MSSTLVEGRIYTVEKVESNTIYVGTVDSHGVPFDGWYEDRFELVTGGQDVLDRLRVALAEARSAGHKIECYIETKESL